MQPTASTSGWLRTFSILASLVLIVACLYFAQKVFILLALAILFAFVLQPLVSIFQRSGLPRAVAVVISLFLGLSAVGALAWVFTSQIRHLAADWPQYQRNIERRIQEIDPWKDEGEKGFILDKLETTGQEIINRLLETALAPVMETILSFVFIIVLVIFMLLKREDLRNRVIRLVGQDRRTIVTTRALDEAARRMSRYLLMQLIINSSFGLVLGVVLSLCGLSYSVLWGCLAAVMRFIPYIGIWVAMVVPTLFSIATSTSWFQPLEVMGVFLTLELVTANLAEPLLFGLSVGVQPLALLVAAIFWGWLWGPIGLLLSTPLTVCLYVLGRHIPQLEFLDVMLGDEPVLDTSVIYYQRLLAHDQDEAVDVIEEQLKDHSMEHIYDEVLIPALVLAKRDREYGELEEEDQRFIIDSTRNLISELNESASVAPSSKVEGVHGDGEPGEPRPGVLVFGCPARDVSDELALTIFQQLVSSSSALFEIVPATLLSSELISRIEKEKPLIVLIGSLPPGGIAQTRYLCKRLKARFPELKILVGRWGVKESVETLWERLREVGADQVGATLGECRAQLMPLIQSSAASPDRVKPAMTA